MSTKRILTLFAPELFWSASTNYDEIYSNHWNVYHPFIYLFLIYSPVTLTNTALFPECLNTIVTHKMFAINRKHIYDDILNTIPYLDTS